MQDTSLVCNSKTWKPSIGWEVLISECAGMKDWEHEGLGVGDNVKLAQEQMQWEKCPQVADVLTGQKDNITVKQ